MWKALPATPTTNLSNNNKTIKEIKMKNVKNIKSSSKMAFQAGGKAARDRALIPLEIWIKLFWEMLEDKNI